MVMKGQEIAVEWDSKITPIISIIGSCSDGMYGKTVVATHFILKGAHGLLIGLDGVLVLRLMNINSSLHHLYIPGINLNRLWHRAIF